MATDRDASTFQTLDHFFTQARGTPPGPPAPEPTGPVAPPPNHTPEQQWASEEKARLDTYLARQFAVLQQQRQELTTWRSNIEQTLVAREQELNRVTRLIEVRTAALNEKEQELKQREALLDQRSAEFHDLEGQVRRELEAREKELLAAGRELEAMYEELRTRHAQNPRA